MRARAGVDATPIRGVGLPLRSLRGDERGIAMVMALGVLVALSIVVAALVDYSSTNARNARVGGSSQSAESLAEAGLNEAISVIANAPNPASPSALPPGGSVFERGSVSWSGALSGPVWTVTATSTVKNPTGAADLHSTVSARFRVAIPVALNPAWAYVYADAPDACSRLKNNVTVSAPLYIAGHLCMKNSALVNGPSATVGGTITLENSSAIGTSSVRIPTLHVGIGCSDDDDGPWSLPECSSSNGVWASSIDSSVPPISKPPIDLARWYSEARPGPRASCTTGSFPGGFDNNSSLDHSLPKVTLLPSSSYSCTVTSGPHVLGSIAWAPGSPGTLAVSGVIFFDGDIRVGGQAVYSGYGTIYSSGKIELANTDRLCAVSGCAPGVWDGDAAMLAFVSGSAEEGDDDDDDLPFTMKNNTMFQGGVFTVNDVRLRNSAVFEGPIVARRLKLKNYAQVRSWLPVDGLVNGVPAGNARSVLQLTGSWGG